MSVDAYRAFLPAGLHAASDRAPEHSWWRWQGHDVHIARARRAEAAARVLVVHGVGSHSGGLWPLAALLAGRALDVAAVDLPLYGKTVSPDPAAVRYDDWAQLLVDLIAAEDDGRPLLLVGASLGGLLVCEAATRSGGVAAVVATCLLDPAAAEARAHMTRFGRLGVLGRPLSALVRGPLARVMIRMSAVADMAKMSRDPGLSRLCAEDPLGGAARVPLGFLASYVRYGHRALAEISVPVTLAHPAEDAWTPPSLSLRVLDRMPAPATVVMLPECGHFPAEEPGVTLLLDTVAAIAGQASRTASD